MNGKKQAVMQKARFEEWREFAKGLNSGGKTIQRVKRRKFKAKRGRKPKRKESLLDGGDIISDSQIKLCNKQVERRTSREEARNSMLMGVDMGLIDIKKSEKVWNIYQKWEERDRLVKE